MEILKLNGIGSFLNYEYKVKFDSNNDPEKIKKRIQNIFKDDQKVKLRYPENSASGLKRIINNFSQFLSLVSISAMLIAGIGIAKPNFLLPKSLRRKRRRRRRATRRTTNPLQLCNFPN